MSSLATNALDAEDESGWQIAGEALLGGAVGAAFGAGGALIGPAAAGAGGALAAGLKAAAPPTVAAGKGVAQAAVAGAARGLARTVPVGTKPNSAIFYSGPGNREKANLYAAALGKTTIDRTIGGRIMNGLRLYKYLPGDMADEPWKIMSQRFAGGASGRAYAFARGARPDRVFGRIELPVLIANPAVRNIQYIGGRPF
ncbi:hypothetical protein [Plantactinospora sp. BC1]|uniref:hypothetical protein n=1 Tax=Plantactinospora sp. BC1 TaxID=2108470 RepID=UPI00131F316A|nr:hypothetical protein [Plantactinospora sp. BC1]